MTKREVYDVIESVFNTIDNEHRDEVLTLVAKERAALDHKNEKAKERAAEKRAAGDELRAKVLGGMNDEPITIDGILTALGDESLTPAKITARTRQLVAAGEITKTMVKVDGRKLTAYTLA
jgi:hypothetical protein